MKHMKKMMALVVATVMMLAMSMTAFADGDGSITVINATKGQNYMAYKIFDATPSDPNNVTQNIVYTATADQVVVKDFDTYFDKILDKKGNYTISKKDTAQDGDIINWVKTNIENLKQGTGISCSWTDNDTATFNSLTYGYYYISSSLGTLVTINTAGKNISVYDKNESTPTGPEKKITDEDNIIDSSLDQKLVSLDENTTSVGSTETFSVTFQATNWVQSDNSNSGGTKVTEWNFTDTPTGMAIVKETVKVTVNGDDVTNNVENLTVDSTSGVLSFKIPWVDSSGKHLYETKTSGSELIPVVVTYDATITADAATAVAPNEVVVKYNNNAELGKDTTKTYTYKFKLEKVDENKSALEGAEFELYFGTSIGDGATPLKFTKESNGDYRYDPNGNVTRIAPTGSTATASIIGLDDTSYILREVIVPAGYTKAGDTSVTGLSRVDVNDTETTKIAIENIKGNQLPSTGGIGTTVFYVIGGILVIIAGVLLVVKRRMKAEK